MKTRVHRTAIGVLTAAAAAFIGSTASADSILVNGTHSSIEDYEDSEGNGDIGNYHILFNRTYSSWTPTGTPYDQRSHALAESDFFDYVYLFGYEHEVISATSFGDGDMTTAPYTYTRNASASFSVNGDAIATPTYSWCQSNTYCADLNKSISKTLFHGNQTFWLGPVPLTVEADVYGSLNASASGRGYGQPFIGRSGYFMGNPASSLSAGAYLGASMTAHVDYAVVDFGVTANFGLLGVSVTPHANELLITRPRNGSTPAKADLSWNLGTPIDITTMNGSVVAWADVWLAGRYDYTIVQWNGVHWGYDIWSDVNQASF